MLEKDLAIKVENVSFEMKKGEFFGIIGRNGMNNLYHHCNV